jgi:coenzyme F420-reducing hydrogenase delta subunit
VEYLQTLIEEIGLGAERIKMVNVSAAMGVQFAQNAKDFSEKIIEIGPNPVGPNPIKIVTEETAI